ncbi:MAG: MerR family transcriptional regulator, partial [Gemmatimonadota bacterium]
MDKPDLRVGEMARRIGLTVRTLHHWDQVGLLTPSRRTPAGHRLYGSSEIWRLQRILSLRALGLNLDEIGSLLRDGALSLEVVLTTHRDRIPAQLDLLQDLAGRLDRVLGLLAEDKIVTEEELIKTMEMMTMIEKHFSPEQLEALKKREVAL